MTKLTSTEQALFEEVRQRRLKAAETFGSELFKGLFNATSDIYPDPAHFVYELLQNADDVEADSVEFILDKDVLYFKHNGLIKFNITSDSKKPLGHINSITAYLSTKADSAGNKIGKFGLGFKSVFVYSDAPEIYDDKFWFKIEKQIVPTLLEKDHPMRKEGETLFVFRLKNAKSAFDEIHQKLSHLEESMLFLNHVKSIIYINKLTKKNFKYVEKHENNKTVDDINYCFVTLESQEKNKRLILFKRKKNLFGESVKSVNVAIAFYLSNNGNILSKDERGISCFFPTSDSFGLPFRCHAPFLLTSNRQNIKNDPFNKKLVEILADTAAEAVRLLTAEKNDKKQPLINDNILDFFPTYFHGSSLYYYSYDKITSARPFYNKFTALLKSGKVFLTWGNLYADASHVYIASNEDIRRLISNEQLSALTNKQDCGFLRLSARRDEDEHDYLEKEIGLKIFDADMLSTYLKSDFMASQELDWVFKFYQFLKTSARISWNPVEGKAGYIHANAKYPMRYAPIIKTDDGTWEAPFVREKEDVKYSSSNEHPNVFLPVKHVEGNYKFVHKDILKTDNAIVLEFLKELGIKEPDGVSYFETEILKHYDQEEISYDTIISDFDYLYSTLEKMNMKERKENIEKLKNKIRAKTIDNYSVNLNQLYDDTPELRAYFQNKEQKIIDIEFYKRSSLGLSTEEIKHFFYEFGLRKWPEILELDINDYRKRYYGSYQSRLRPANCTSISKIQDYDIDEFEDWISQGFTEEASKALWHFLCENPINKYLTATIYYYYRTGKITTKESTLLYQLKNEEWLNIDGEVHTVEDVHREDLLNAGYENNPHLFELLGIYKKHKSITELGGTEEQQKDYELGRKMREAGLTEEDIEILKRIKEGRNIQNQKNESNSNQAQDVKMTDEPVFEEDETSLEDMFDDSIGSRKSPRNNHKKDSPEDNDEIAQLRKKLEEDNEREIEKVTLRQERAEMERYSFEWFVAGLQEEYASTSEESKDGISKAISISFSSVRIDASNSRIFILDSASRDIPLWLEEINDLNVNFLFNNRDELSCTFEVASVREHTLRLKAKAGDEKELSQINWAKYCTLARIDLNNPIDLVDNLRRAFMALELDGLNLKEMLDDHISFIFGPPGTGKTTYLANDVISDLMAKNDICRILVLTPTNKACDVIAKRLLKDNEDSQFWMRRFVASDDTELENEGYVCDRDTDVYNQEKCCLISTIARLPFDCFTSPTKKYLRDIEWDYIVIDEASMISLPQIVYAIYKFDETKIIIAGDPKQIAPIDKAKIWDEENIYSMIELTSFSNPQTEPIQFNITHLSTQYRSIPAIGQLFSQYAYEGELKHKRTMDSQVPLNIPSLPLKPITVFPFAVENIDNMYAAKKLDGSNIHIYSAVLTSEFARYIAKQYKENNSNGIFNIGVICPYRSQAQLITKLIEQMSDIPQDIKITIGTIHSFQGDQCNMVIAVFNPPKGLRRGADDAHVNNLNIVNVAISRAQDYLCIFMPSNSCDGYNNLTELRLLGSISKNKLKEYTGIIQQQELEKLLFGTSHYLDRNVFVTSHQIANVYTRPAAHYEVRCDEKSIDIQVDDFSEDYSNSNYVLGNNIANNFSAVIPNVEDGDSHIDNLKKEDQALDTIKEIISTNKVPTFGLTKLGEYSIGVVGKVEGFLPLIKKYGGYQSNKRMVYEKVTYNGGYIIPHYNIERFLKSLEEEGWNISKLAKSIGFQ